MANSNLPHRTATTLLSSSDSFVEALDLTRRPVINAEEGGMYGWAGNVFEYLSVQPHVSQQAWCIMLSTPAFFSRLPAGNHLHSLCKSFFENRSQSFEGLRDQTEIEFASIEWTGHKLSIPVGATRTLGEVSHTAYDVEGEPFTKLFKIWSQWGLMDPEILNAKLVLLNDPGDMLMDETTASAIYFETTRNMRDISHAAIAVGIQPSSTVPIELKRNKAEENQLRQIQMEFKCLVEFDTYAVKQIARQMLQLLPLYNPDAITAPEGFQSRTSILESLSNSGTIERMAKAKSSTFGISGGGIAGTNIPGLATQGGLYMG